MHSSNGMGEISNGDTGDNHYNQRGNTRGRGNAYNGMRGGRGGRGNF